MSIGYAENTTYLTMESWQHKVIPMGSGALKNASNNPGNRTI